MEKTTIINNIKKFIEITERETKIRQALIDKNKNVDLSTLSLESLKCIQLQFLIINKYDLVLEQKLK